MQNGLFEFILLEAQVGVINNHVFCCTEVVLLDVFEQILATLSAVGLFWTWNNAV